MSLTGLGTNHESWEALTLAKLQAETAAILEAPELNFSAGNLHRPKPKQGHESTPTGPGASGQ